MERYKNIGGNSGVSYYEIGEDFIIVYFSDNSSYLYNYAKTGSMNVEKMKLFAVNGQGLNSFINITVKYKYALKLR